MALHLLDDPNLNRQLITIILNHSSEGIVVSNAKNQIIYANPAFMKITGYTLEEISGQSGSFLRSEHHNDTFYKELWTMMETKNHWEGEMWVRRRSGEIFLEWLNFVTIRDDNEEISHFLAIFSDITALKTSEERIQYLSHYDPLTTLANRFKIQEQIELNLKLAEKNHYKFALLSIDVDHFKKINSTFGLITGDFVLQSIATRLQSFLKRDEMLARYNDDEFMILVPKIIGINALTYLSQEILNILQEPFLINDEQLYCTMSMGISIFPEDGHSVEELIKNTYSALYRAKEVGRNNLQFFRQDMNARAREHLTLENHLHLALEKEEFELFYQPLVSLKTNKICGAEALIRWQNEKLGSVPPNKFIPIAESSGLIIPISDWILKTVCKTNYQWLTIGLPPIPISVNISSIHFHQKNFITKITQVLQETMLNPRYLKLELTESIMMENSELTIQTLFSLKELGLHLSIDDFGTGYSSLSYLKKFPIDQLKIDQSFIRDLVTDMEDREIIRAIINLAKSLKLNVVAEGVETKEHLNFLRNEGCDVIQGYYFSKPIRAEEFAKILKSGKTLE